MDDISAKLANEQTKRFYEEEARAFSATRSLPWPGWSRAIRHISKIPKAKRLLDIGCGNLRFERALEANGIRFERMLGIDACKGIIGTETLPANMGILRLDAIDGLDSGRLSEAISRERYDAIVAFGFMHHIPQARMRRQLLELIAESLDVGGVGIVSFWQLSRSDRILAKAIGATERARSQLGIELEPGSGDYFLGWQESEDALRFCHDFSDEEIDALISGLNVIDRYSADGSTNDLNHYVVISG